MENSLLLNLDIDKEKCNLLDKNDYLCIGSTLCHIADTYFTLKKTSEASFGLYDKELHTTCSEDEFKKNYFNSTVFARLSISVYTQSSSTISFQYIKSDNFPIKVFMASDCHTVPEIEDILNDLLNAIRPLILSHLSEDIHESSGQNSKCNSCTPSHKKTYFSKPSDFWTAVGAIAGVVGVFLAIVFYFLS